MKKTKLLATALLTLLAAASAAAQQSPNSPVVLRSPITTLDSQEGIIADVTIPAHGQMPLHQHPGDEFLYMLQGTVELTLHDQSIRQLKAGDAYQIPAGTIHSPAAGPDGARAIVFRVHPSGLEVTLPVEDESHE